MLCVILFFLYKFIPPYPFLSYFEATIVPVINCGNKFLVRKRPESGLLAGLWDFPHISFDAEADDESRKSTLLNDHLECEYKLTLDYSSAVTNIQSLGEITHLFSHIKLTMHVNLISLESSLNAVIPGLDNDASCKFRWIDREEIQGGAAVPTTFTKVLALVDSKSFQGIKTKKQQIKSATTASQGKKRKADEEEEQEAEKKDEVEEE